MGFAVLLQALIKAKDACEARKAATQVVAKPGGMSRAHVFWGCLGLVKADFKDAG